jgi:hypothetical protein
VGADARSSSSVSVRLRCCDPSFGRECFGPMDGGEEETDTGKPSGKHAEFGMGDSQKLRSLREHLFALRQLDITAIEAMKF